MIKGRSYLLVDSKVAPQVFNKVIRAKRLLSTGQAKSASEAAVMSGISRSVFYKYRDTVFAFDSDFSGEIATINALLDDRPGVLSGFITKLYDCGANILTVNQNIPVNGIANVTVSIRVNGLKKGLDELLASLSLTDGIMKLEPVSLS